MRYTSAKVAHRRAYSRPSCPNCGEILRRERVRDERDGSVVHSLRCACGHVEGHAVERAAVPA